MEVCEAYGDLSEEEEEGEEEGGGDLGEDLGGSDKENGEVVVIEQSNENIEEKEIRKLEL
jgi:hypothetical protein